jgi:hypothetical protein
MAFTRTLLQAFDARNDVYAGGSVAVYATDGAGNPTATLVTLYAGPAGADALANPQVLDGHGRFKQPVYFETPCIMRVSSAFAVSHDSGVLTPALSAADVAAAQAAAVAAAAALAAVQAVVATANLPDPATLVTKRDYQFTFAN